MTKKATTSEAKDDWSQEEWDQAFYSSFNNKGAKAPPTETQVGGNHYMCSTIQPIEYIVANNLDFCQGNVVKYVTRFRHKNGLEDLLKAKHYIDFLIEDLNKGEL